jgi:regulator of replication initiation timing
MKYFLLFILFSFVLFNTFSDDSQKLKDLEKRLDDLEKQNNELSLELEETKRNLADNSNDINKADSNKPAVQKVQWGKGAALEISGGLQAIYTQVHIGIIFPKINNILILGLKFDYSQSISPYNYFDKKDDTITKVFPSIISLTSSIGATTPLYFNFMRFYGIGEVFTGYKIRDSRVDSENIVTAAFGVFGFAGLEIYFSPIVCFYIETGGGWLGFYDFAIRDNKDSNYNVDRGELYNEIGGSGFGFRIGMRFYFTKKSK